MKINEVTQPSDKVLFERFAADNNTGFLTEDLVKIYRSHQGEWDSCSADEAIDDIDALMELDRLEEAEKNAA